MLHFLVGIQHLLMGRQQTVMKPFDDHHRQDHQAVLMGLESTKKGICHIPDERGLLLDVLPHRGHLFICGHKIALSVSVSFVYDKIFYYLIRSIPDAIGNHNINT